MTYTDPGTFASAAVLTAAQLNVIGDDIRYLKSEADGTAFTGVSLARGTTQSIPTGVYTDLVPTSAPVDAGGWWTSGATFTVPASAVPSGASVVYLEISASARYDANATGSRGIAVLQNGSATEMSFFTSGLSGDTTPVAVTVWAACAAGDALTVQGFQSSGGSLNVNQVAIHVKRIGWA